MEKSRNLDIGLLILRVSLGVMMLLHGIAKLFKGVGGIEGMMEQSGLPGFLAFGALALFFTGGGNLAISKGSKWD